MNKKILNIIEPILVFILIRVLKSLKPLILSEDDKLKEKLSEYGFHIALCNHPSILFGYRNAESNQKCLLLSFKVWYLVRCIRLGLLKQSNKYKILDFFSISSYYGNGVEFWFEESHTPIIQYNFPKVNSRSSKKIAIYTALTGNYDLVNEILYKEDCVDYFLFTNNYLIESNTWNVIYVESELDNQLLSRDIKMFPHKYLDNSYEISIYIDANAVIYGELSKLGNVLSEKYKFAVTKHSIRQSLKEEYEACVKIKGVDKKLADEQYNKYIKEGYIENITLAECGLLIRLHNNEEIRYLMSEWYNEYKNGIRRDQLSLLPVIYRTNFTDLIILEGNIWHNQFFKLISHN